MSTTPFTPQSEISQQVNVETAVPMIRELAEKMSPGMSSEEAMMRLLGTLRHSVHPDMGEALEEFSVALTQRLVDEGSLRRNASWGVIEGSVGLDGRCTI